MQARGVALTALALALAPAARAAVVRVGVMANGELLIGTLLALRHVREWNGTIVPALGALADCPLELQARAVVGTSARVASEALLAYIAGVNTFGWQVVVGPETSGAAAPIALLAGYLDTAQVGFATTSPALDNVATYKHFSRVVPSDEAVAASVGAYVRACGWRRMGIVHVADLFGIGYAQTLGRWCAEHGIELVAASFELADPTTINVALRALGDVRIIAAVGQQDDWRLLVDAARQLGMIGGGYHWVLGGTFIGSPALPDELARLLHGSALVRVAGGRNGQRAWEALKAAWASVGDDEVNALLGDAGWAARSGSGEMISQALAMRAPEDDWVAFAYDATVAVALAACAPGLGEARGTFPGGAALTAGIGRLGFAGASGDVYFDAQGSRAFNAVAVVLENLRWAPSPDGGGGGALERVREMGEHTPGSGWALSPSFVYADGTSTRPSDGKPPSASPRAARGAGGARAAGGAALGAGASRPPGWQTLLAIVTLGSAVLCSGAAALAYRQRLRRLQSRLDESAAAPRLEPERIVIITDAGEDLDDEMALVMARFLTDHKLIELLAVVANLRPAAARARLVRGTLDALRLQAVPVGVGSDGGSLTHRDTFSETAAGYISPGARGWATRACARGRVEPCTRAHSVSAASPLACLSLPCHPPPPPPPPPPPLLPMPIGAAPHARSRVAARDDDRARPRAAAAGTRRGAAALGHAALHLVHEGRGALPARPCAALRRKAQARRRDGRRRRGGAQAASGARGRVATARALRARHG